MSGTFQCKIYFQRLFKTVLRALDKFVYRVKYETIWQDTHLFKFLCLSCTKIKKSITQLIFFQTVMSRFLFTRLGKGRANPNWFPMKYVRFITETWQIFIRKETRLSLPWINSVACGNNPKPPTLFYFRFHNTLYARCKRRNIFKVKPSRLVCFLSRKYSNFL